MAQTCPHCKAWLPEVVDPTCPRCGVDLNAPPANVTEVPGKVALIGASVEYGAYSLVLVLVIAGFVYALVQSIGEKDAALSVVFGLVILGCGAVLYTTVRNLVICLRGR
jgi:hypothetical protein